MTNFQPALFQLDEAHPTLSSQVQAAAAGEASQRVDAAHDAPGNYKIIPAHAHLKQLSQLYYSRRVQGAFGIIDDLIRTALPHVQLPGGYVPQLDDLQVYGVMLERGAYFPHLHSDTDWMLFPGSHGFQLWYMVKPPADGLGNMFLADCSTCNGHDGPLLWDFVAPNKITRTLHNLQSPEYPLARFDSLDKAGLRFKYLNMTAGECLIFSKRMQHMSDPRPFAWRHSEPDRVALQLRVVVRDPNTRRHPIPTWENHPYIKLKSAKWKRKWLLTSNGSSHLRVERRYDMFEYSLSSMKADGRSLGQCQHPS